MPLIYTVLLYEGKVFLYLYNIKKLLVRLKTMHKVCYEEGLRKIIPTKTILSELFHVYNKVWKINAVC